MTKFDQIMTKLVAVVFLATCFGFIVWAGSFEAVFQGIAWIVAVWVAVLEAV